MDTTEATRREMIKEINGNPKTREELQNAFGQTWNTEELSRDYEVVAFLAPFVQVRRREDNAVGTMLFQHEPRFYFSFEVVRNR